MYETMNSCQKIFCQISVVRKGHFTGKVPFLSQISCNDVAYLPLMCAGEIFKQSVTVDVRNEIRYARNWTFCYFIFQKAHSLAPLLGEVDMRRSFRTRLSTKMSKYMECWGADKPFANISESTLAKNIRLTVKNISLFIDFKNFIKFSLLFIALIDG